MMYRVWYLHNTVPVSVEIESSGWQRAFAAVLRIFMDMDWPAPDVILIEEQVGMHWKRIWSKV
jgi:hypothetical protein